MPVNKKLIAIILCSFTFSGCFYHAQRVPEIEGVVIKDGEPLKGIVVQYISQKCRNDRRVGVTPLI